MKRNIVAVICAVVVAAAVVVPFGLRGAGAPAPEAAAQPQTGQAAQAANPASAAGEQGNSEASGSDAMPNPEVATSLDTAAPNHTDDADEDGAYEQGVILVGLQDGATAADLNARLAQLDYIATKQVADDDIAFGYVELALADGVGVEDAETRIAADNPDVIAEAQPNYVYHIVGDTPTATDSPGSSATAGTGAWLGSNAMTGMDGALDRTAASTAPAASAAPAASTAPEASLVAGIVAQAASVSDSYASMQWNLDAVHAYDAWDTAKTEGAVTVAVIDTGIDTDHEDFSPDSIVGPQNTVKQYDAWGKARGYETGKDQTSVEDGNGHGTHVAGIVAATANNGKGVAGVSYNAKIMPIRALDDGGSGNSSDISAAIGYVIANANAHNVKIVNMSLGGKADADELDNSDKAMMAAIKAAHDAGLIVVYAAGNEAQKYHGAYNNLPSDHDGDECALGVISVMKNGDTYKRSSFSNYNKSGQTTKNIAAPGSSIYSTVPSGGYAYESGTSMAAPCVAGIAALAFAANPDLSARQVCNIICTTAQDLGDEGWDAETGYGLVDAAAVVELAKESESDVGTQDPPEPEVEPQEESGPDDGTQDSPELEVDPQEESGPNDGLQDSPSPVLGPPVVDAPIVDAPVVDAPVVDAPVVDASAIDISGATVMPAFAKCTYDGRPHTPGVAVALNGRWLAPGTDFSTTYLNNTDVGPATVVVAGKGSYTGLAAASFTIVPKATKLTKLKARKRGFTAKWKKIAAQTSGYQVQRCLRSDFASGVRTYTVKGSSTNSRKFTKLKSNRKYYVRVRTFKTVNGMRCYSPWSAKKSVKTK